MQFLTQNSLKQCCAIIENPAALRLRDALGFLFLFSKLYRLGLGIGARSCSSINATPKARLSCHGLTTICTPMGNPKASSKPTGIAMAGQPVRLEVMAKAKVSSLSNVVPWGKASSPFTGQIITSYAFMNESMALLYCRH